ncbi:hypothetical protein EG835_07345, partial [bacterium]|nr:hypothetical protein [bacterium]
MRGRRVPCLRRRSRRGSRSARRGPRASCRVPRRFVDIQPTRQGDKVHIRIIGVHGASIESRLRSASPGFSIPTPECRGPGPGARRALQGRLGPRDVPPKCTARCHTCVVRRLGVVLVVALAAAGPGSCRRPPLPIRIAIHSAPQSFDPHLQNEILTAAVLANIFDSLTEFDEESQIRPALAAEWTNPDARTWVFRLRPGVLFHDGRPLTAEDVVFSLARARKHPRTDLASYLVEVESVKALDPLTVEIRTRRPFAALLVKLSPIPIVPRGSPETITRPVGTGSYRFLKYEEGKSI